METNNNQPQDEAAEQFELELTDDQLEAVAGGVDPRTFVRNAAVAFDTDLTAPIRPSGGRPSQSFTLDADK